MPGAALVADEDRELRSLLSAALKSAGFDVLEAGAPAQVQEEMGWLATRAADALLLVVSEQLAGYPTAGLAAVLGTRMRQCGRRVYVLFTRDLGSDFSPPPVHPCEELGSLEKPFDLDRFQALCAATLERSPCGVVI